MGRPHAALPMGPGWGDSMGANSMWSFSIKGGAHATPPTGTPAAAAKARGAAAAKGMVTARGIDLARFIADEIVGRAVPPAEGKYVRPAVLIKMDPEGSELDIVDRLLDEGARTPVLLVSYCWWGTAADYCC